MSVRRVSPFSRPRNNAQSVNYADVYRRAADQMGGGVPNISFTPSNVRTLEGINNRLGPGMAPDTGMTSDQLYQAMLTGPTTRPTGGGGGGGSRRGGGGGGGSAAVGVDPNVANAYQALLASYGGDQMNGLFDQAGSRVSNIQAQAGADVRGILGEMDARASQARQQVGQSITQGNERLQALLGQYQPDVGQLDALLGAYGAGRVSAGNSADQTIRAAQGSNQAVGNAYDTLYADRGAVSAGLGADVLTGQARQAEGLRQQLEMQRVAQQLVQERELAQLRLQAAQAGIQL